MAFNMKIKLNYILNYNFLEYHASCAPPGIMDGPYLAPSSPPETPVPIKNKLFSFNRLHLLFVSLYSELPPSIIISPGSKRPIF
jgi:hypothetical protein